VTYTPATAATRVAGGWQATLNGSSNTNWLIRARGYYATGFNNKAGSIVESIRQVYLSCPTIAPTSLPAGTAGLPYSATFTAPGALGVVAFSVTGALPAGLTLSTAGTLSGTPTQAGTFVLTVHATDQSSGCSGSQAVTLPISPTAPILTLDKTALRFAAVTTGAAFVSQTAAQVVRLTQSGAGTVTWTAVPSQPWLQVSPASGSGSADVSISVIAVPGLPVGSPVAGAITLTVMGASNTPGPITVVLDLLLNELSVPPFGVVDTPVDHSTGVTGAVPFTGWALDDVDVTRVMVCRAAVGPEVAPVDPNCAGAAQIFVGFGVFIDGARPDVAAAYPTYPRHTRGGWGFMVLTNMLPDIPMALPAGGNGTFQFFMYAEDRDGHTTLLGTRTLTCANATATKPFGAIDTPTQGGVASGSGYAVYGWVLSRTARADPPGGGTVTVQVNGVTVGSPGGWAARPDLSAAFPGYPGIDTALGVYGLNTLAYANGVHTIQWTVTDSLGVTEGIGSRFFTVSNGAGALTMTTSVEASARARTVPAEDLVALPPDVGPVLGRRGWDLERPWRWYRVGREGRAVIEGEEIDRFELWLEAQSGEHYTGHLRVGGALSALPAGSQLDAETGWFTWAPGVGFVGTYDLVFVRWVGDRAVSRHDVRMILRPKGSAAVRKD
jgi:Putative Ig domain/Viral BACON domain